MKAIDIHTHTLPDSIAAQSFEMLSGKSHTRLFSDGTLAGLQASMARSGIAFSAVLPVATAARQVPRINASSIAIQAAFRDTGILSFGCMHPDYEDWNHELKRIREAGLKGIKLHPVYQGADFDDPRYLRILNKAGELGLIVLIHAGDDVGFPGEVRSSPAMILNALKSVGPLKLVLAHMGGWRCWDEVEDLLAGQQVYLDTSFCLGDMVPIEDGYYSHPSQLTRISVEQFVRMVRLFGSSHILFGSDSPWDDQATVLRRILDLPLTDTEKQAILYDNAASLLDIG